MKPHSQAQERIIEAAIGVFAEKGYEAGAMQEIADKVGIRKASLYAHFDKKDTLFLLCYQWAVRSEMVYISSLPSSLKEHLPGFDYAYELKSRYGRYDTLKLLLKIAFFQPKHLKESINEGYEHYLLLLKQRFANEIQASSDLDEKWLASLPEAYLGMVDSLHVELIYANEATFDQRLRGFEDLFSAVL